MNNIAYAYNWLIGKGLSPNAAAGVVGNLKAESGVNPNSNQPDGPGRGIAQWSEGGRWETLKQWAGNKDIYDLDTQLGFLWHELNTGYRHVLNQLQNTHNMAEATEVFMKEFEIPADTSPSAVQGRVALADDVRDNVKVREGNVAGSGGGGGGDMNNKQQNEFDAMLAAAGFPEWLLDEFPQLKNIYQDAVKGKWTPDRFLGEVKSSDWYQNRSDAMFTWDTTRPEEKKAQIDAMKASLADQAAALGVNIDGKKLKQLAEFGLRFGYNDAQVRDALASQYKYSSNGPTGGTIGTALDEIDAVAWEWGMDMSRQMRKKWAEKIATGDADVAAFRDMAEQRARKDYSWLKESFDAGKSLGEIVDPYRQTMASLLEISPDQISMKDKQIRKALSWSAGQGQNAEQGLAPIYEFENALRQDARWQKTKNAKDEYMNFGMKVLQDFGVMA